MRGSSKVIDRLLCLMGGLSGTLACQSSPQSAPPVASGVRVESTSAAGSEAAAVPAPLNQFDGESFSLRWSASVPVVVGQTNQGQLVLTAKPPFKCNQEYPFKLKLSAGGLDPAKAELTKADMQVTHEQVTVPVTFAATKPGAAVIDAVLAFSVCTDDKCLIERQSLRLGAEVVPSK